MKIRNILLGLAALILLSGCSKEDNTAVSNLPSSASETATAYEYTAQQLTMQSGEDSFKAIANAGDSEHHVLCESFHGGYYMITADTAGNLTSAVPLSVPSEMEPMAAAADTEGGFVVAAYQVTEASADKLDSLLSVGRYDSGGGFIETLFTVEDVFCPLFLLPWEDGYLLGINKEPSPQNTRASDRLLYWKNGAATECAFEGDFITDIIADELGVILCIGTQYTNADDLTSEIRYDLCRYDPSAQTTTYLLTPSGKVDMLRVENGLLDCQCDGALCTIDLTTGQEEKKVGLIEVGVSLSQGFLGGWTNGSEFVLLTSAGRFLKVSEEEVPVVRETVTLGYVDSLGIPSEVIAQFNLTNPDYRLELIGYADEGALGMALAAGEGPDLMDVSLVPIYSYAKKGVFADLYPLLDENGGRENYVSSVVSLAESEGKLYTIPVRFALWGMLIRNDYYETHPSVTLDDLLELSAEELFLSEPLRTLVEANLTLFSSDNALQELEKILILSKTAQEASVVSQSPVVQMPYGWYQVSQYCDAQRILDDYAPAGWPELGTDGLAAYPLVELAINADAGCAQGAWAALSYMLSLEGQEAMQDYGLPVSIPALDIQFQSAQADGMSQEQADQFRNMIAGAGAIVRQDSTILTICQEEIQALYAEDKTAHECAEVIMNRVNIYLEEQTTD